MNAFEIFGLLLIPNFKKNLSLATLSSLPLPPSVQKKVCPLVTFLLTVLNLEVFILISHVKPMCIFQGATIVDQCISIALAPEYKLPVAAASALPTVISSSNIICFVLE